MGRGKQVLKRIAFVYTVYVHMHTKLFNLNISGSVFSCSVSPSGSIAATGGEDDKAYVWDMNTGNVLHTCTGHKVSNYAQISIPIYL